MVCVEWKESFASVIQSKSNSIPFQIGLLKTNSHTHFFFFFFSHSFLLYQVHTEYSGAHTLFAVYTETHDDTRLSKQRLCCFCKHWGRFLSELCEKFTLLAAPQIYLMQDFNPFMSTVLYYHQQHHQHGTTCFSLFLQSSENLLFNLSALVFFFCIDAITSLEQQK